MLWVSPLHREAFRAYWVRYGLTESPPVPLVRGTMTVWGWSGLPDDARPVIAAASSRTPRWTAWEWKCGECGGVRYTLRLPPGVHPSEVRLPRGIQRLHDRPCGASGGED